MDWEEVMHISLSIGKTIKKKLVDLRIARGGCFIAKYFTGSIIVNGENSDMFQEIKIYDNLKYYKERGA